MRWQARRKRSLPPCPWRDSSAAQVATLYHERWEIELGYRDIKSAMQHNAITLRSKKVDLVYQGCGIAAWIQSGQAGGQPGRRSPSASAQ